MQSIDVNIRTSEAGRFMIVSQASRGFDIKRHVGIVAPMRDGLTAYGAANGQTVAAHFPCTLDECWGEEALRDAVTFLLAVRHGRYVPKWREV